MGIIINRVILLCTGLAVVYASEPDSMACCEASGVPAMCRQQFCNLANPPTVPADNSLLAFLQHYSKCKKQMPVIAKCLADGRNNSACCRRNNNADSRSCFDLCDASAVTGQEVWAHVSRHVQKYNECILLNIGDVYSCYMEGYAMSPSQPQNLAISVLEPTKVRVSWMPPAKNKHLVDHYSIRITTNVPTDTPLVMATTHLNVELPDLRPDTKYSLTVVAVASDGEHESLPTTATSFVTTGVVPTLIPYQSRIDAALHTDITVVCKIEVMGWQHKHVQVLWEKLNPATGGYDILENTRATAKYDLTAYVSAYHRQPRTYISALKIRDVSLSDLGTYQCTANNAFGKGGSKIVVSPVIDPIVSPSPPNTTRCCQNAGVSRECLSSCMDGNTTLPSHTSCILDATKILGCSMSGNDLGACCLRRRVPTHCLSFCDGTLHDINSSPNPFAGDYSSHLQSRGAYLHCFYHTQQIYNCIEEKTVILPESPRSITVQTSSSSSVSVRWPTCNRAQRYHVYYRTFDSSGSSSTDWQLQSVLSTNAQLTDLQPERYHEVVVVASNDSGQSGPSKTIRVFTGRIQRDMAMPFDPDDVSSRFRSTRKRNNAAGRLMEEHFDS